MSEQENGVKELEKMTKIARDTICNYECRFCGCKCDYYDASLALYNAGYRKEEEVRKKILEQLIEYGGLR